MQINAIRLNFGANYAQKSTKEKRANVALYKTDENSALLNSILKNGSFSAKNVEDIAKNTSYSYGERIESKEKIYSLLKQKVNPNNNDIIAKIITKTNENSYPYIAPLAKCGYDIGKMVEAPGEIVYCYSSLKTGLATKFVEIRREHQNNKRACDMELLKYTVGELITRRILFVDSENSAKRSHSKEIYEIIAKDDNPIIDGRKYEQIIKYVENNNINFLKDENIKDVEKYNAVIRMIKAYRGEF